MRIDQIPISDLQLNPKRDKNNGRPGMDLWVIYASLFMNYVEIKLPFSCMVWKRCLFLHLGEKQKLFRGKGARLFSENKKYCCLTVLNLLSEQRGTEYSFFTDEKIYNRLKFLINETI